MTLTDKIVLITGSAKRLGREVALALARQGAHIIIHYNRSQAEARQTAEDIRAEGVRAWHTQADLNQTAAIERLFAWVEGEVGRLDVLINNASAFRKGPFMQLTPDEWDATMHVNLRAPAFATQHAASLMMVHGGGVVINYGDMMGSSPDSGYPDHSVSKAALLMLTQVTAKALGPHSIRVNAIVPGPVYRSAHLSEQAWQRLGSKLPLQRPGSAANVAQATIALIENDFITGAVLHVDGGDSLLSMEDVL